jgi:hypothetical protein
MHSPAQMPMGTPNGQQSMFNGGNGGNGGGNSFNNIQNHAGNNGFPFNEDFNGPPIQSPGILSSGGMPDDAGLDSLLGGDDPSTPTAQVSTIFYLSISRDPY